MVKEEQDWRNKKAVNTFPLTTQLNGLPALMNIEEFYTNWNWFSRTVFQRPSPERLPGRCREPFPPQEESAVCSLARRLEGDEHPCCSSG